MLTGHVDLEREVLPNLVVIAGYAGSRGYNLAQAIEGNPAVPQILPMAPSSFRPMRRGKTPTGVRSTSGPRTGDLGTTPCSSGPRSASAGGSRQVSYTFGKVIDETQGQVGIDATNSSVFPQDPIDPRNDRGPADFDVRHVLTMNVTWELPFGEQLTGLAGAFARGWQINGVGVLRSGVPFSPSIQTGVNWSRSGNMANGTEIAPTCGRASLPEDMVLGGPESVLRSKCIRAAAARRYSGMRDETC